MPYHNSPARLHYIISQWILSMIKSVWTKATLVPSPEVMHVWIRAAYTPVRASLEAYPLPSREAIGRDCIQPGSQMQWVAYSNLGAKAMGPKR